MGLIPGSGRSPEAGHGNPLWYSCLENPHGQRSLVGYSPWGHKESDMTEEIQYAGMQSNIHPDLFTEIYDAPYFLLSLPRTMKSALGKARHLLTSARYCLEKEPVCWQESRIAVWVNKLVSVIFYSKVTPSNLQNKI